MLHWDLKKILLCILLDIIDFHTHNLLYSHTFLFSVYPLVLKLDVEVPSSLEFPNQISIFLYIVFEIDLSESSGQSLTEVEMELLH